jgi:hypothetical protein
MPGPLQSLVSALGLDGSQTAPLEPDTLGVLSQQYPRFAQALEQAQRNTIRLNLEGPTVTGGPEPPQLSPDQMQQQLPGAPPAPSLLDRAGAFLSTGQLPDTLKQLYLQHGPEAFAQGLRHLNRAVYQHAPQGRLTMAQLAPALNETLTGAGTTLAPLAAPAAVLHPLGALIGGIAGTALAGGGEHVATSLGADPDTAKLVGNIAGFLPPEHLAMAALPFAPYARNALMKTLEEASASKVKALLQESPALAPMVKWLHPSETVALAKMSPAAQAEFLQVHQALPSNDLLGALGRAGGEKLGWYEHSRAAIQHVYGDDADLFAGVLAATSPQNSVEMNLKNATKIYRGWVQAGRPTDRESIIKIMGENVQGTKGDESVLSSWKNNTVSVLQGGQAISGPKVDSFWRNLRNRAVETPYGTMRPQDAVTLDAWMSNVLGIKQTYFAGKGANLEARNPGYGPGYLASTAKLREAATASGMTPEQLQETIWSWGKALYEQSEKTKVPAVDIVKSGTLDHSAIAGTPDFSTLFHQGDYHDAIIGTSPTHAAQLATLKPSTFPTVETPSPRDLKWQLQAAETLDKLRQSRDIASDLRTGANVPGTVGISIPQEGMPGGASRVAPELATSAFSQEQRDRFARQLLKPNTDVRGENVLLKAMSLPTAETTVGLGQWTPPEGGPTQYNTLDAAGARVRLRGREVHPADAKRIVTAARLQGLFDAQDAVATTGVVYDQAHKDTLHVFTQNKVKQDVFEGLTKLLPKDYALVNKGGGTPGHVIDIVRLDGAPVGDTESELVRGYLSKYTNAGAREIAITPGTNVAGSYLDLPWHTGPGSGRVSATALEHYDQLPKSVQAGLDSPAVKRLAAAKLKVWETEGAKRGLTVPADYRQMLQIVADGGISALHRVVASAEQLVPVLLMLGLARSASETPQTRGDSSS